MTNVRKRVFLCALPRRQRACGYSQLNVLEGHLNKGTCDVEGWLLLAMHRFPRTGNSARAVLDTIGVSVASRCIPALLNFVGFFLCVPCARVFIHASFLASMSWMRVER